MWSRKSSKSKFGPIITDYGCGHFEEEVEDFIGEGGGNLKRTLHFWEAKILTKKHLKTKKVSKQERLNIPCSLILHCTGAERHF